jgi:hypothetical protein
MQIKEFYIAKDGKPFENRNLCEEYEKSLTEEDVFPYIYSFKESFYEKKHNPEYSQNAECKCGHLYYRHFDSYEEPISACGCKYCDCYHFQLKK